MRKEELIQKISNLGKDVFDFKDLRKLFPEESNLKVAIKRLKESGVVVPITKGVYALKQGSLDVEKIATQIYYPSYISFESALSKYGIINQGLYKLTLATTRHSKKINLAGTDCEYSKLKKELFFGFNLMGNTYIAEPEKAFLDEIYLIALGKRARSYSDWDVKSLSESKVKEFIKPFNKEVKSIANGLVGGLCP